MFNKPVFLLAVLLSAPLGFVVPGLRAEEPAASASPASASPFPLQLEVAVPHPPTPLASDGRQHLLYELVLRNHESRPLELQQLAVLDANSVAPLATFNAEQLPGLIRRVGGRTEQPGTMLPNGGSVTVYLRLDFPAGMKVPSHLRHWLLTSAGELTTDTVSTGHDAVQTLGAPVTGGGWLAETGFSNDNGHRRGPMLQHGHPVISRRYAFDWVKVSNGEMVAGDKSVNTAYFGYGESLVAVDDAIVVAVTSNIPENVAGRAPTVPSTLATIPGNTVVLDIGDGQYAHYMHMQNGSIRVQAGDVVQRGDVLGVIGNSGDSFAPHLHFEVTTSPVALAGEGVPYLIESFDVIDAATGTATRHEAELPREKMLVNFVE